MKRTSQPKRLILPGAPSHSLEFENFSKLVPAKELKKLEKILGIVPPSDGFCHSLARFLWSFYRNSLPGAKIKFSRAVLVRKLRKAAERAEGLAKLAEELWASEDAIVIRAGRIRPSGLGLAILAASTSIGIWHRICRRPRDVRPQDTLARSNSPPRPWRATKGSAG